MTRLPAMPVAPAVAVLAMVVVPLAAGCVSNAPAGGDAGTIGVESFYVLGEDGARIVGEVENVGPGVTRELVVQAATGAYVAACKPGMAGDGIRWSFAVTGAGAGAPASPSGSGAQRLADAEAAYLAYVRAHAAHLIAGIRAFADAYAAGDDDAARDGYAATRVHWESIEPVAESFGDLDPLLDAREADVAEGDAWSGWHLVEKDLWPPTNDASGGAAYVPLTAAQRAAATKDLVAYTQQLVDKVNAPAFTFAAFQIANGAKELLDEVAAGKVTGEEEIWSHTDLWDFQANVDGAKQAFEVLKAAAAAHDPALVATLDERFVALNALLATHGSLDAGFKSYDQLTDAEVQALAAAVDALAEPLSSLTTAVTSGG